MKLIQHVWMACIGLCLFSCTQTDELETAQGKTGFIVSLTDGTKLDVSRATPGDIVDSEGIEGADFNLRIVNTETEGEIYNDKVGTEVIKAYSGVYDLTATYGENPVLALDAPYFKGETTGVEVFNNKTTQVTIACKVANALVSVTYDNSKALFEDVYSNYYVEVKVGSATPVQIDKTGAKSAYMQAGSAFEVIFHGTPKDANEDKSVVLDTEFGVPATLNAGDHLKLTLSPKLDRFDIPLNIESVAVETAPLTEEIPMEWLPKPKVEAEGFTNNELSFVETEQKDAKLKLTLSSALQDIKFKFNFEDEQFASLGEEKEYLWSDEENRKVISEQLGIAVSDNSIDLNGLLAKLQTNAGATTTNIIEVDVKANDRWSSENKTANLTYKLTCNKPEFTVDAYPGNIWTKEFTVSTLREEQVTSGDFTTLSRDMTYQYSIDGQTNWMTLNDGMRQDRLLPGTTYYIRGLYRGEVPGEVTEVMTYPETPLENGNLNIYTPTESNANYGTRYYWDNWATLNELTCDNAVGVQCWYNSRSGTQPIIGPDNSTAAWIATIGWGYGSSNWATIFGDRGTIKYITPGELFLGSLADVDHDDDVASRNYGISFYSRPTSVSFKYKYEPYDGDHTDIFVQVLCDDIVLGEKSFQQSSTISSWTEVTDELEIDYNKYQENMDLIPNKLILVFKSGVKESVERNKQINDVLRVGSQLYIDDVELVYAK